MSDPHRNTWDARHAAGGVAGTPSPFVVRARLRVGPGPGRVLDVACGRGRHALVFARHGWTVEAVDWSDAAIGIVHEQARREGLAIEGQVRDVASWAMPPVQWDVVVVTAFLERALFARLREAVRPGGVVVYETFRVGHERFGHPTRPDYLLRPGELAETFGDWTTLDAYEGTVARDGRAAMMSGIVARRP